MKISDEIRRWCDFYCGKSINRYDCDNLSALADRIDSEMVELPKDADGREVPLDTKELYDANGKKVNITSFAFRCDAHGCWSDWKAFSPDARREDGMFYVDGLYITPPDSLESIARDLEDWADGNISGSAQSFADRIRELAKKEG